MYYLDYAASTPVSDQVRKTLWDTLDCFGNPSSIHNMGIIANKIINDASCEVAIKINCKLNEIHYTSGATMSNNLAIHGFFKCNPKAHFITSKIEHNDIMMLATEYGAKYVTNDIFGRINISDLENKIINLRKNDDYPILVSIQYANSEIGTIQDMRNISKVCHKYKDVYLHTDATQFIPYYPIDVQLFNIDMLSMSGQKIGCIKGTGLLYIKENTPISSIILGEQGLIGGTENVIGIACLGTAFKNLTYRNIDKMTMCRSYLIKKMNGTLIGLNDENRLPNNILMRFDGVKAESLLAILNEYEIYVSAGSACSSSNGKPSHVLLALGMSEKDANSCIRFTFNANLEHRDMLIISEVVNECYGLLKE